ncbi:MAG: hypothetical protein JW889_13780 [Verrucomicrobia bacterium]|nr:hypothetical protein [Verrucomicrobiota bacterium]
MIIWFSDGSGFLEKIEQAEDPNDAGDDYDYVVVAAYDYDLTGATLTVRNGQDDPQSGGDSEVQYVCNCYPDGSTWKVTDARDVTVPACRLDVTAPGLWEREEEGGM